MFCALPKQEFPKQECSWYTGDVLSSCQRTAKAKLRKANSSLGTSQIFEREDFKEIAQVLFQDLEMPICFLSVHSHRDRSRHRVCTRGEQGQLAGGKQGRGCCVQAHGWLWAVGLCLEDTPARYECTRVYHIPGQHYMATACTDTAHK